MRSPGPPDSTVMNLLAHHAGWGSPAVFTQRRALPGPRQHGRMVKTDIDVYADGKVVIQTVNRGEALGRWLDLLKGRRHLAAVDAGQEN